MVENNTQCLPKILQILRIVNFALLDNNLQENSPENSPTKKLISRVDFLLKNVPSIKSEVVAFLGCLFAQVCSFCYFFF
jgi:hypothetical protein